MRSALALLVLLTAPLAAAQTPDAESGDVRVARYVVVADTVDAPRRVEIRLDSLAERVGGLFGADGPIGARMRRFEIEVDDGTLRVQTDDDGLDAETAQRMRRLQRDARRLADRARAGDRDAERELDGVLEELFEVRGEMRRVRAESMRERAEALLQRADELDAEAERRQRDRHRLIEQRKRALMGDDGAPDW